MPLRTEITGLLLALASLSLSGCSLWSKNTSPSKNESWSIKKLWKKEYQKPQSVAVIWSPDVLTVTGQPPTRGFGGRVFFYNEITQAIPVDGELIVHGYRSIPLLGQSEQVKADKTFAFTAEQLTSHFSPSELGASYSIWIPWDAADGMREEVTLIPTFKGKDGTLIQGTAAKLYLPGRSLELGSKSNTTPAQTVSYQKRVTATNDGVELPRLSKEKHTTTISVPPAATTPRKAFTLGANNSPAASENLDPTAKNTLVGQQPSGSSAVQAGGTTQPPRSFQLPSKGGQTESSVPSLPTSPNFGKVQTASATQLKHIAPPQDATWIQNPELRPASFAH